MTIQRPDEMEISSEDNGERVVLTFRSDSGESQAVSLARAQLPTFVSKLVQEIETGSAVPINKGSLQIGATFSVAGFEVRRRNDGARRLILAVDLPDEGRVVTLPLELTPKDVATLMKMLGPEQQL